MREVGTQQRAPSTRCLAPLNHTRSPQQRISLGERVTSFVHRLIRVQGVIRGWKASREFPQFFLELHPEGIQLVQPVGDLSSEQGIQTVHPLPYSS